MVAGELGEAMRFARRDGLDQEEVIRRISHSEDELNVFEREDGSARNLVTLPPDEKALMKEMLKASEHLRHQLKEINDVPSLEALAAEAQNIKIDFRTKIFKMQLGKLSPEDKGKIKSRAREIMDQAIEGSLGQ